MQQKKIFYGWTIVAVAFLIGLTQAGVFQNVLSIFLKPMSQAFGWNRSIITGSIAVGSLSGGILSPVLGPYLDRHGPRKAAFWGITILSAGLIALSQLSSVWQLYLFFGTGRMISSGLLSLVVTVSVSNWFIEKRGRAMGISQLGSRIGIAFLPLLVQHIILSYGWRTAWAVLGGIVFAFSALPSLIFLKRRPEDVGLLPDGRAPEKNLRSGKAPDETKQATVLNLENEPVWTRKTAFQTVSFWQLVFVMCVIYLVGAGSNFHLFPFMTDQGLPATMAVLVITVLSVCAALGGVLFGFLAEKISVKILMGGVLITIGILFYTVFWAVKSPVWIFLFALVYGTIRGGVLPLIFLLWTEFYGRRSSGTVLGIAGPFRMAANAAGPVSAAIFFDLFHSYWIPFSAFTILLVMAGLLCLAAKPPVSPQLGFPPGK
ncbi:MAG: hypothetical protein CSA25_01470 [Desulfobacter postgatei]|uniref:Major facilitator superfamily (MFS) profile domain-containing protein n=1 Tax=Desulfobacter postgatei TaxID=2293 RepID=A0A2G6MSS8_9BACT|nr:MAG: hypothetical protein CSA25_01470 [Desulfobacter postgatei]